MRQSAWIPLHSGEGWSELAELVYALCTWGNPTAAPEQGFLSPPYTQVECAVPHFCHLICVWLMLWPPLPWASLLSDAGERAGPQLGLIWAVYLIKTWEDPSGMNRRKDTHTIYSLTCTHTHSGLERQGEDVRYWPYGTKMFPTENQPNIFSLHNKDNIKWWFSVGGKDVTVIKKRRYCFIAFTTGSQWVHLW